MYKTDEISLLAEQLKTVQHSKRGRYIVTCREDEFIFLPIENMRTGDDVLMCYTEVDLICGLSPSQWWKLNDQIDEYTGDDK